MDIVELDEADGPDRDEMLRRLRGEEFFFKDGWTQPLRPVSLGGLSWTPDFISGNRVLVLIVGGQVPNFMKKRLLAASDRELSIVCAIDIVALSSAETIKLLSSIDADVSLLTDKGFSVPLPLLKFLGVEQMAVAADIRRDLIHQGIERCQQAATNSAKGKTLEWLLHFMFSQVAGFRVRECNYRTASEELDVVIQLTTLDGARCWSHMNAPFLVAEAKNRKEKSGQEVISKLNTIISLKRGTCKVGFVISLSGFTSDARIQVLKLASQDRIFVLMDIDVIRRWACSNDYDQELDDIVSEAALN